MGGVLFAVRQLCLLGGVVYVAVAGGLTPLTLLVGGLLLAAQQYDLRHWRTTAPQRRLQAQLDRLRATQQDGAVAPIVYDPAQTIVEEIVAVRRYRPMASSTPAPQPTVRAAAARPTGARKAASSSPTSATDMHEPRVVGQGMALPAPKPGFKL